eukprot:517961-Karenia_brevis.AAC.1
MESNKIINSDDGVYEPFSMIWQHEGKDADGYRAAQLYVMKCLMMKGRWLRFNAFTERLEFLYIKSKVSEQFVQDWSMVGRL